MKDFGDYLREEIELSGNRGLPDDFINNTDRTEQRRMNIQKDTIPPDQGQRPPRESIDAINKMMQLIDQSQAIVYGGSAEEVEHTLTSLEELAEAVILSIYESILDNVILDIKMVRKGGVVTEMPAIGDVAQQTMKREWIDDLELLKKIDKQKLINNIIQGEAKNTKNILHSDMVKYELQNIFGPKSTQIFNIWDEMTKLAEKMDWIVKIPSKSQAMSDAPENMAGAVQVSWVEEKEKGPQEAQEKPQAQQEPDVTPTEYKVGQDCDACKDQEGVSVPKIKAVGIDFPMLLHEAVKGIYQLISSISLPDGSASEEEKQDAEYILQNVESMEDEAEDFRYGPVISGKLRDAVNECKGSNEYPNCREHVFGRLCGMDADRFLNIMKRILDPNQSAKTDLEAIIREVNGEITEEERDYQMSKLDGGDDDYDDSDYKDQGEEDGEYADGGGEESDIDNLISRTARGGKEEGKDKKEVDEYATMSVPALQRAMDAALDDGDFELVRKIGGYLKESYVMSRIKNYLRS